jgi:hypothetical protein
VLKVFSGKPFGGVVTKYDSKRNLYSIRYEDGDEEEMDEGELALVRRCRLTLSNPRCKRLELSS